ncbi:MAG: GSCFA domain-containing protein [bacterium]
MNFRTEIIPDISTIPIEHHHKILTIGSCFAENIGEYFFYYKFDVLSNPFGVLYNPVSIFNGIKILSDEKMFTEKDLIFDQDEWHSFYHHSDFSHHDKQKCLDKINSGIKRTKEFLTSSDYFIITYGTAFVFEHKERGIIVSNCHKIPGNQFNRYLLSFEDTKQRIDRTINLLKEINSKLKIILTISPVRHWRDGAVDNQLSKSILFLALHESIKGKENCFYFPSYEIVMDDLRDYRFYKQDMLHPNNIATDYIWDKFSGTFLSEGCLKIITEVKKIIQAAEHRPRNTNSPKHKEFAASMIKLIDTLEKKHPHINLESERNIFTV